MIDRALLPLLAGCVIFAGVIALELQPAPSGEPTIASPVVQAETKPQPRVPAPGVEELVATAEARPLFNPSRRPTEKTSPTNAGEPELSDVRLTGIVMEADRHLAIFAIAGTKPLVRSEGESVKEWRLDSILPNEVSLSGPGGLKTLAPKTDPNLVRPAPPAPSGPAAPGQANGRPAQPSAAIASFPAAGRPPTPVAVQPQANLPAGQTPNAAAIPLRPRGAPRSSQ
jgi:hypothetical protein